jgi:hypothetical protein
MLAGREAGMDGQALFKCGACGWPARSALGSKAEKLKAKQWGFSSEKSELFADEPGPPVAMLEAPEI